MSPPLILVTLILFTAGALCTALAARIWIQRNQKSALAFEVVQQQITTLQTQITELATQWHQRDALPLSPAVPVKGFNLNRRAEAVRRMRAGHQPDQLVSATGWSAAELELLQKVERLT